MVVLSRARGALPVTIAGCGRTLDAMHLTAPDPEGRGAERAMTAALAQADQPARPTRPAPAALTLPDVQLPEGLTLVAQEGKLVLKGKAVSQALAQDLAEWLATRAG